MIVDVHSVFKTASLETRFQRIGPDENMTCHDWLLVLLSLKTIHGQLPIHIVSKIRLQSYFLQKKRGENLEQTLRARRFFSLLKNCSLSWAKTCITFKDLNSGNNFLDLFLKSMLNTSWVNSPSTPAPAISTGELFEKSGISIFFT